MRSMPSSRAHHVVALGEGGWLRQLRRRSARVRRPRRSARRAHAVPCIRETFSLRHGGLADFAFAMQGLGSGPICLFGSERADQRTPVTFQGIRGGQTAVAAFAHFGGGWLAPTWPRCRPERWSLTVMHFVARRPQKTWISNGGRRRPVRAYSPAPARHPTPRACPHSSWKLPTPRGFRVARAHRRDPRAPSIGDSSPSRAAECRQKTGCSDRNRARGFKIAMATLDIFRSTVGAAALGIRPPRDG